MYSVYSVKMAERGEGGEGNLRRKRADSKVASLVKYHTLLEKTILCYQDPVTGLLPAFITKDGVPGGEFQGHAWIRDNVYCVLSIWAMSLSFRGHGEGEEDKQTANKLEKNAVKLMRSLLLCMLGQADKVEAFKKTLNKDTALHAKFSMSTCGSVVGDNEWGHLQIDATSLFLLVLAQMTASGIQIVYNLDEVDFIQNLIFYIETAYRTPDYGIWERGDKTNHGQTELNATSIGMAKAALEAMSGLDLFGARGGPSSVIHVLADQVAQCNAKLTSLLPRESSSKEIDAGLLSIISFPAFAIESFELIKETKEQILEKLMGNYGCKRFLRDGYHTVRENSSRLHYESAELKIFENIECEWPLFLIYLLIDAIINNNHLEIRTYKDKLDSVILHKDGGIETVPELYYVPWEHVDEEARHPHATSRNVGRKVQSMWSQGLFVLAGLLQEGLVNIGEIDPLNRRLCTLSKPEPIVQVVLLAEDRKLCSQLKAQGIVTQTLDNSGTRTRSDTVPDVTVLPAKLLGEAYQYLGKNNKMGLSGRYKKIIGVLSTSMLYYLDGKLYAFYPSFLDQETFYLSLDSELLVDVISTDLSYLKSNWKLMGCPLLTLPILWTMLGDADSWDSSPVFRLLHKIKSGYMNGVRLQLGDFSDFLSTSCEVNMTFLENDSSIWSRHVLMSRRSVTILPDDNDTRARTYSDSSPVGGVVKKSRATPAGETKVQDMQISLSPSLRHLQVARGWSTRRHSYTGGKLLRSSAESPKPEERREKSVMATLTLEDLLHELETSTNVFDQTDILHILHDNYGKDFKANINGTSCTVTMLLEELYEKVGFYHQWSLVRHTAGILRKSVEDMSQIVTDLLVRQKTISIGQPTSNSEILITQPLPQYELLQLIFKACGGDHSAIALTQELLVYLAMFIRSEPRLFDEMLRLRVGLIQNVMVTELARSLNCSSVDAVNELLLLGPFELKNLLHHLLSRKEFSVDQSSSSGRATVTADTATRQLSIVTPNRRYRSGKLKEQVKALETGQSEEEGEKLGQWRRRRRIDGALNRVPPDFYTQVWHCLEKCDGLFIGNQILPKFPTIHEMTAGELKFALKVESVLNSLPDPEYRQLVVEVLMLTALINPEKPLPQVINVDDIIKTANFLFLMDQKECNGLAVQCCGHIKGSCQAYWAICSHFYDSAPSGVYGTMSYLSRALLQNIRQNLPRDYSCKIS